MWGGYLLSSLLIVLILVYHFDNLSKSKVVFDYDGILNIDYDRMTYFQINPYYQEREYGFLGMYSYPTDVVFVGDSLTQNCQWNELFPKLNIKNRGIGSDTTDGVIARLDSVIKTQPKKVFLMIGINDISMDIPEEVIVDNYKNIIVKIKEELPDSDLYIQSILPCAGEKGELYNVRIERVNEEIKYLSNEYECVYIDLYKKFANENGYLKDCYNYDNVHITVNGYEVWYDEVKKYIE